MCFKSNLTDDIIPPVTVKVFPNQKLWVAKTVHMALKGCATVYDKWLISGNMSLVSFCHEGSQTATLQS